MKTEPLLSVTADASEKDVLAVRQIHADAELVNERSGRSGR